MTTTEQALLARGPDADKSLILSEQVVVGTAAATTAGAEALGDVITNVEWFLRPAHKIIFGTAMRLAEAGNPVDLPAILHELTVTGELRVCGGGEYLHTCQAQAVAGNALWHAGRVRDAGRQRTLLEELKRAVCVAADPGFDPETGFDRVRDIVDKATSVETGRELRDFRAVMTDAISALETKNERGLALPWRSLNELLLGLAPGQLVVVGARPAIGKSVALGGIAAHAALTLGRPALLVSAEMSEIEFATRLIASYARVNLHALLGRYLDERDWDRAMAMYEKYADAPLMIDDTPGPTLAHIKARLRGVARTAPPALLAVDYLQLLSAPRAENRQVAVSELSWGLKIIAREWGIPVVVAAQLNRNPESRSDKVPQLADLRESGSLEQNADVVILLHREDAYDQESPRAGEIDLIVAKNRQGPTAVITEAFQGHFARMVDMAKWDKTEGK